MRLSIPRPSSTSFSSSPIEELVMKTLGLAVALIVSQLAAGDSSSAIDRLLDHIVERENALISAAPCRRASVDRYFQFDSWRINVSAGLWVPSQIYVEEQGSLLEGRPAIPRFKAQTRIWGYAAAGSSNKLEELTRS